MSDLFRDQPKLRLAIGVTIAAVAWAFFIVRALFGIGPAHDYDGNQAPASHYLLGALAVTAMIAAWIRLSAKVKRD